jgi:hypothetical protein
MRKDLRRGNAQKTRFSQFSSVTWVRYQDVIVQPIFQFVRSGPDANQIETFLRGLPDKLDGLEHDGVDDEAVDAFKKWSEAVRKRDGEAIKVAEELLVSRRAALSQRYGLVFPSHVLCTATLTPFAIQKGYYVNLKAKQELTHVSVFYRTSGGSEKEQFVADRLTGDGKQLNPGDVNWTVGPNEWITVVSAEGSFTFPTNNLIKR